MSLFPPRQRPDESDLEWAIRLHTWSQRTFRQIEVLYALCGIAVLVAALLFFWMLA
jgi:hypothetical protein